MLSGDSPPDAMMSTRFLKHWWNLLFIGSILITLFGFAMLVWGIAEGLPWESSAIGVFIMVMGGLLMRMIRGTLRSGQRPRPRDTFLLIFVIICTQLWIAFVSGVQR